jgi:hypothetical protein
VDVHFKQHATTELLTLKKIPLSTFITICMPCMGDKCVDVITVRHWVWKFKQEAGEASLCEKPKSQFQGSFWVILERKLRDYYRR